MAGEDVDKEQKQFDPSAKRLKEFREKGRVAVSRDLAGAVQLAAIIVGFLVSGHALVRGIAESITWTIDYTGDAAGRELEVGEVLTHVMQVLLLPIAILSGILILATAIAYLVQTGFLFNFSGVAPQLNRLNPASRLSELFSPKNFFVKSGLTVAKLGLAAVAVMSVLAARMPEIAALGTGTFEQGIATLLATLSSMLVMTVALLAVVAAVDYLWQRRKLSSELKMTREEVKKETEEEEGRPEIKHKRRQKHRELSLNRIMVEVPKADVVLTNPTHVAVALRYRGGVDKAPIVVAKGAEELAALIRQVARKNVVPIIEQRSLARALYNTVKVGKAIPASFFQAVAQVLAQVYRARREAGRRAGP